MSFRSLSELLASDDCVVGVGTAFKFRAGQLRMAQKIEAAIEAGQSLAVEAPSGSGKTLAYLLPAFLQSRPVIISTATRYLQKQLISQDIPLVQQLLSCKKSVALLQGRRHYFCPYYAEKNQQSDRLRPELRQQLTALTRKFRASGCGELSSLVKGLSIGLRAYASCDVDDCLGKRCPQYDHCPYFAATSKAARAQILIVNHSILLSEHNRLPMDKGEDQPLYSGRVVILDEAHRILDFGDNLLQGAISSQKIKNFCREVEQALLKFCPEQKALLLFVKQIIPALDLLASELPSSDPYHYKQHIAIVEQLMLTFTRMRKYLEQLQLRDTLLLELSLRCQNLLTLLQKLTQPQVLCWTQARGNGFFIKAIPADLSQHIRHFINRSADGWIFTSATLSIADNPARFLSAVGLERQHYLQVTGDIDYQSQAVLYLPAVTCNPSDSGFIEEFVKTLIPLVDRCAGRILVLFSSFKNLEMAATYLRGSVTIPLLVQSQGKSSREGNKQELIHKFKASSKGLLLGTGSFWEGLDLSGVPLSAVVIDKLPFASPDSPLLQLRLSELERHGVDVFEQSTLPDAVMRLRQGCGRLLRRKSDRGVIMIADKRLRTMPYGEVFLASLPPMAQFESISQLSPVLEQWHSEGNTLASKPVTLKV